MAGAIGLLALAACGQDDASRPGFPRTARTPLEGAPFPYASAEEVGLSADELWLFKERLYSRVVARRVVGGEILVIKDRRIVLHQALGWADRERLVPLERNSIFRIASMTKPFAGTAVLMLEEEGLLSFDDRVADHFPSFDNPRSGAITIRQLLLHRSGFVQGGQPRGYRESPDLRDAVDLLGAAGPVFPPGEEFIYSNLNSDLLGAIVAEITGEPVERFLEQRILTPLGLSDTHAHFSPDASWASRVVSTYHRWSGPWEKYWSPTREEDWLWFSPAGGLFGSAFDYAVFLAAWMDRGQHAEGRLLAEVTVEEALADPRPETSPESDADPSPDADPASDVDSVNVSADPESGLPPDRYYGMHWEIYAPPSTPDALPVFGHRGATGTLGMAFPEQDVIVIYLTGSEENDVVDEVMETALEMFGGDDRVSQPID